MNTTPISGKRILSALVGFIDTDMPALLQMLIYYEFKDADHDAK